MKNTKEILAIIFATFIFSFAKDVQAATYYVCDSATACNDQSNGWSTGNDSNSCSSKSIPCKTIAGGIERMSGGDTLMVGDGTYIANEYTGVHNPPSGTPGAYTYIQAEHTGGVLIDVSSAGNWLSTGIAIGTNYVQVEGFKVKGNLTNENSNGPMYITGHHNKIIRCAAYNACQTGNMQVFDLGGHDNLAEECWAWGTGRYKFISYHSYNNVYRRCVARHDYHGGNDGWSHQEALFTNYDSTNTTYQNCIGLDSGTEGNDTEQIYGGFWDENNIVADKSGAVDGCILLNIKDNYAGMLDKASGNRNISNTVIWDSGGGWGTAAGNDGARSAYPAVVALSNMTIGTITGTYETTYESMGIGAASTFTSDFTGSINNSIIYDAREYGIYKNMTSNYNALYANSTNYHFPATPGVNDRTTINPVTSGLLYLPRIESGFTLKTGGFEGGQIGAQVMYRIGISGTLYGEAGYNVLTDDPLWPFPNEDIIKTDFSSYAGTGPSGQRGFCTGSSLDGSSQTLTKYIWEYLGNQIPAEVYGSSGDITPPSNPSGLTIR